MKKLILVPILCLLALSFPPPIFADLSDGLVAFYPFNGNADDESGNNNNASVHGAALSSGVDGSEESAYYFDGINDYFRVPNSETLKSYGVNNQISL